MFSRKQTLNVLILQILYVKSTYDFSYEISNLKSKNIYAPLLKKQIHSGQNSLFFAQTGKEKHKDEN